MFMNYQISIYFTAKLLLRKEIAFSSETGFFVKYRKKKKKGHHFIVRSPVAYKINVSVR